MPKVLPSTLIESDEAEYLFKVWKTIKRAKRLSSAIPAR